MGTEWQSFELAQRASSVLVALGYGIATIVIVTLFRRQLTLIGVLARCLVRIARPAKHIAVEGSPPYR
jgi:hypothetical protein